MHERATAGPQQSAARALRSSVPGHSRPGAGGGLGPASLQRLQASAGNQAVQRLVSLQRDVDFTNGGPPGAAPPAASSAYNGDTSAAEITTGELKLGTPMVRADGVIQADTIIANTIVASTYTPGVGNIE